ncbi:SRPBCC domain-containing protein [Microvirga tunisiensis]|uniref:SRPBCC domain-containing protein n=1 Tax=Microvirga tunisiensis TaxID=2108360 RepID=UPI003CC7CBEB
MNRRYHARHPKSRGPARMDTKYLEVVPNERIVWTNDEDEEGVVTTVTFEDQGGKTLLTFHEVYPSKEALEEALQGSAAALPEQLEQLDELLSSKSE